MATYRVGESGATVFNEKGEAIASLRPGYVVVEGLLKNPGSPAEQHQRLIDRPAMRKRLGNYADKTITPPEDKGL